MCSFHLRCWFRYRA